MPDCYPHFLRLKVNITMFLNSSRVSDGTHTSSKTHIQSHTCTKHFFSFLLGLVTDLLVLKLDQWLITSWHIYILEFCNPSCLQDTQMQRQTCKQVYTNAWGTNWCFLIQLRYRKKTWNLAFAKICYLHTMARKSMWVFFHRLILKCDLIKV